MNSNKIMPKIVLIMSNWQGSLYNAPYLVGQHLKKSSLSESSSDMMDLDDGVESTPGLLGDSQARLAPFLEAHTITEKQNCCKQPPAGQNLQQRHNSALAVSIETDVWLLGK